jgi:hypothetical protein
MWYDVITGQNYFANKDIVTQYDGLAMGAPSSGLIAEMFLQNIEHLHLAHITHKCGDIHILHNVLLCSVLRTSEQRFLSHPLSRSHQQNGPFLAPASETKSAGHAYQLCQPANGRTDRTEETRIKRGLSEPQGSRKE